MAESRPCPVCHTAVEHATLFLDKNIDETQLSSFSFASRKQPEYMCNRLMQCPTCDLVYADQPPDDSVLAQAYHTADYDSATEADDAASAYIRAIQPTLKMLARRERVLEIGTGTGVFLEHLSHEGFDQLVGVEPSVAAITAAPPHRQAWIRQGMFNEHDFEPASFDLICCFMTMEHVLDPNEITRAAYRLLREGGAFVIVVHSYRSFVNRLLGKKSPIIDIEHMQLFSNNSVHYLFDSNQFEKTTVNAFVNTYALRYWLRLAPLPRILNTGISKILAALGLLDMKLGVNVGNIIGAGFKRG